MIILDFKLEAVPNSGTGRGNTGRTQWSHWISGDRMGVQRDGGWWNLQGKVPEQRKLHKEIQKSAWGYSELPAAQLNCMCVELKFITAGTTNKQIKKVC